MEIGKLAIEWAEAEVFSSKFFIAFGLGFVLACIGFWQLSKTEMAKAYITPSLVCGLLLLAVGIGIFSANKARTKSFKTAYEADKVAFVESEIQRTEQSMKEYRNIVFKVIPAIIVVAALLLVFMDKPNWRATCVCVVMMMIVIVLIDSNANARLLEYHEQLQLVK